MTRAETNAPGRAGGQACELRIEKLVHGGLGLARLERRVVFTPFVLPGERVRVELGAQRGGLWQARLLEVLEPAAGRVEPACPYFGRCGGCQLQHSEYASQLELKRAVLAETLRRLGRFEPPCSIRIIHAPPWHYRNRVQFHLAGAKLGFFERDGRRVQAVEQCMIASPKINQALVALARALQQRSHWHLAGTLEVFTNEDQVVLRAAAPGAHSPPRPLLALCHQADIGPVSSELDYPAAGEVYRVGMHSFFQVNRFLIDQLVACALEGAEGETAVDLYAGVGLFSLPLARRFRRVIAVEASRAAARDLASNVCRAGVAVKVCATSAAAGLRDLNETPDFLLADPPRTGLGREVVAELVRLRPPRLSLVSCEPATLARDLAPLLAAGYRIAQLSLVDLFPQTYHIEAVATLSL